MPEGKLLRKRTHREGVRYFDAPHPNIEVDGLVHRTVQRVMHPAESMTYELACGAEQFANTAHEPPAAQAPVTCMGCLVDGRLMEADNLHGVELPRDFVQKDSVGAYHSAIYEAWTWMDENGIVHATRVFVDGAGREYSEGVMACDTANRSLTEYTRCNMPITCSVCLAAEERSVV